MANDNPQLMSNGCMLVTGQKVKFHKSKNLVYLLFYLIMDVYL